MIGMDLLMGGPNAAAQAVAGAVAGHAWLWAVWGTSLGHTGPLAEYARAPRWLSDWLDGSNRRPPQQPGAGGPGAGMAAGGVHAMPPRRTQEASTRVGHSWGSGQRLGSN
jgi:Derlin-2/3